jgi:hypothetical protein
MGNYIPSDYKSKSGYKLKPKRVFNKSTNMWNYEIIDSLYGRSGLTGKNNQSLAFDILGVCGITDDGTRIYCIEFRKTKYQKATVVLGGVGNCPITDRFNRNICGVACIGNVLWSEHDILYQTWSKMISRNYKENTDVYDLYKNVGVCDRWLIYENFKKDAVKIDGYNSNLISSGKVVLDKDIGSYNSGIYEYNLNNCKFINKKLNNKLQLKHQNFMRFYYSDDINFVHYNMTEVYTVLNFDYNRMRWTLQGKQDNYKGWKIEYYYPDKISVKYLNDLDNDLKLIKNKLVFTKFKHKQKFKAIKDGKVYYHHSKNKFAKLMGIYGKFIYDYIKGDIDNYKGWHFENIDNLPKDISGLKYLEYLKTQYGVDIDEQIL